MVLVKMSMTAKRHLQRALPHTLEYKKTQGPAGRPTKLHTRNQDQSVSSPVELSGEKCVLVQNPRKAKLIGIHTRTDWSGRTDC
jgi:hypothetical protein